MIIANINRYQIKSEIGRGGMATVYHAYDPSFERDVAIKVLPQALLHDPQFRTRFEREAKMIALLEHPAIVPVYDFGEQDGQPYIVMRYMAGGSLADQLKQGSLPIEDTSRIISRLAPALDAAHARGIIHRDLKPGNVLFDQYGNAFLSDFGIARLAQQENASLTGTAIVGTPAYMSPEQVQGDKEIDGRSDIYALGVLVYQMLTRQQPYQSDTPAKVMMMHLLDPVPSLAGHRDDLPAGCDIVLKKALAKNPDERYATTDEFADALEAAVRGISAGTQATPGPDDLTEVAGKTVAPAPQKVVATSSADRITETTPSPIPQTRPESRRARIPLWLITIIILVVTGGIVILGGFAFMGFQGNGSLAMFAPQTATPTQASSPTPRSPTNTPTLAPTTALPAIMADTPTPLPTDTPPPVATETTIPTPEPTALVIGGADKIGFIMDGDIWLANLDGSDLQQLTIDGAQKTNLQWMPGGQAIKYIVGKCAQIVHIGDTRVDLLTCFNFVDSFKAFEISPDGSKVAISLDNQLYIVPFDVATLNQVSIRSDLTEMAECKDFAPYQKNFVAGARWSNDGQILAVNLLANTGSGTRGNIIQLIPVNRCIPNPRALDNFPPPRFEMDGYDDNPVIQNFDWDGIYWFALNNFVRNDGFGDLYLYNTNLHKSNNAVNPVLGKCCYRDPHWSPDGSHLLVAFQDYLGGANSMTQLYLIPFGTMGTGAQYQPLPLPEISDSREKPQAILRPVEE